MSNITPTRYLSETEFETLAPTLPVGTYNVDITNSSGTGSGEFLVTTSKADASIQINEISDILLTTSNHSIITSDGVYLVANPTNIVIDTLDHWAGVTGDCSVKTYNTYFNYNSDCYANEKLLYNKITSEAFDQHGVKGDWYVVDYSTNNEKIFGEDLDKHITNNFPVKVYMEAPMEERQYNQFGMEDLDNFVAYCNMLQFEKYSNGYVPKYGDIFRPYYNGVFYEIINVYNTDDQFLNTPHTWRFTLRVWRNNMLTTDNSVTGERSMTYDNTNAISTEPPSELTDISEYTENGSDTLKQNDIVEEIIDDQKFDDPNPINTNNNPFGGW